MRERSVLITAGLAAVVVLAAVVITLLTRDNGPVMHGALSPSHCSDEITVYLANDKEMQQAAESLRSDPTIGQLSTETQQQAYERFIEIFKNRPELVKLARPEALPASIHARPRSGTEARDLKAHLSTVYPPDKVLGRPC
jgi:cell division protein FtsX